MRRLLRRFRRNATRLLTDEEARELIARHEARKIQYLHEFDKVYELSYYDRGDDWWPKYNYSRRPNELVGKFHCPTCGLPFANPS